MRLTSLKSVLPAISSPLTLVCLLVALVLSTLASFRLSAALNLQTQLDSMRFDVSEWMAEPAVAPSFAVAQDAWAVQSTGSMSPTLAQETNLPLVLEASMTASSEEKASAFIRLPEGRTAFFRPGDTVFESITLSEVHSDHVLLEDNGRVQRLSFPDPAVSKNQSAFQGSVAPPTSSTSPAPASLTGDLSSPAEERGELSEADAPSRDSENAQQEAVRRRLMQIRNQSRNGNSNE